MANPAPPAPGSLNFTAQNVFGLSQYDGQTLAGAFFENSLDPTAPSILPEASTAWQHHDSNELPKEVRHVPNLLHAVPMSAALNLLRASISLSFLSLPGAFKLDGLVWSSRELTVLTPTISLGK